MKFKSFFLVSIVCFIVHFKNHAAAQVNTAYSQIIATHSAKCIDKRKNSLLDNDSLVQYTCKALTAQNAQHQHWTLKLYKGSYQIVDRESQKCMTGKDTQQGSSISQQSCTLNANQLWQIKPYGDTYQIISKNSGFCLEVKEASDNDEAPLVQGMCLGQSNQLWSIPGKVTLPTIPTFLMAKHSGQCLHINEGSTALRAVALQSTCLNEASSNFYLKPYDDDTYQIVARHSGLCLNVEGSNKNSGAKILQYTCNGGLNNLWTFKPYEYGAYQIIAKHSGQCLNVQNANLQPGMQLSQQTCNADAHNLWSLSSISLPSVWSAPLALSMVPVAAANLPDGNILTWASSDRFSYPVTVPGKTFTSIFNAKTLTFSEQLVTETGHDMFCPGTANLADGRLLVNGGNTNSKTSIYDSFSRQWIQANPMKIARGYQSNTVLSNGNVFTIGGSWSGGLGNKDGELWSSSAEDWKKLPGVKVEPILGDDPQGIYRSDNHAWLFAVQKGWVFHAGPSAQMNWIDTNGIGQIISAGNRGDDNYSINGQAVMYETGKILKTGGAPAYQDAWATNNTYLIDIKTNPVVVKKLAPMNYKRAMANGVILPDGQVLIVGGQTYALPFSDNKTILVPELWNPVTQVFRALPAMKTPRNYHSVGLLMNDGRVMVGGGGLCGNCPTNHANIEIFTPPYLLNENGSLAKRPAIISMPEKAQHGAKINVVTDSPIIQFALLRLSSVTHTINNDQRRIPLRAWSNTKHNYLLEIPNDSGVVIPGYYMLFAMNTKGVPSISKSILIQ